MKKDISTATSLHQHGLKSTYARQCVLQIMESRKKPLTPLEIHTLTGKAHHPPSLVTVYRILEAFAEKGILHRHPCDGRFSLCHLPAKKDDQHAFMHCMSCGSMEEFLLPAFGTFLRSSLRSRQFRPAECITEVHGTCSLCS